MEKLKAIALSLLREKKVIIMSDLRFVAPVIS
jgi:hypothetical protein